MSHGYVVLVSVVVSVSLNKLAHIDCGSVLSLVPDDSLLLTINTITTVINPAKIIKPINNAIPDIEFVSCSCGIGSCGIGCGCVIGYASMLRFIYNVIFLHSNFI